MIDHAFQHTRVAPLEYNSHPSPSMRSREIHRLGVLDGHLNVDSGLDLDLSHLTDDIRGAVEVNEALVDAHLVPIEGSRTVTGRRLAHREHEVLRGHADGALHLEVILAEGTELLLGRADEVRADLLERAHVAAREGDADARGVWR